VIPGIYKIINTINNKVYIGSSRNLKKREKTHFYKLDHNTHTNRHLQSAYLKYGKAAFLFEIIMFCPIEELITN
jgi:group I intron endonuclease